MVILLVIFKVAVFFVVAILVVIAVVDGLRG